MTLKLNGTNSEAAPAYAGDDADTGLQCGTNELKLVTGGTARATVDSSGRLLVGTTSDTAPGAFNAKIQTASTSFDGSISLRRDSNNTGAQSLVFGKSRGSLNGNTIVQSGDTLGTIDFYGADGTDLNTAAAQIFAQVDGTPGSNDMPGRLIVATTADGANSPTERLRITSDGTIRLGSGCPGIDFSQIQTNASGMTSETLDSYEEGTFTPAFANSSGSTANISSQPAIRKGSYTKIGNRVFFNCWLTGTLTTTETTSAVRIIDLPFNANSNVNSYAAVTVWNYGGFNTYKDEFYARNQNGNNQIILQRYGADLKFNDLEKTAINQMYAGHYYV